MYRNHLQLLPWKLIGCSFNQVKGYNTPVLKFIFSEISVKFDEKNKFVTRFFQRRLKIGKNWQKSNISEDFRQKGLPVTLKIKFHQPDAVRGKNWTSLAFGLSFSSSSRETCKKLKFEILK